MNAMRGEGYVPLSPAHATNKNPLNSHQHRARCLEQKLLHLETKIHQELSLYQVQVLRAHHTHKQTTDRTQVADECVTLKLISLTTSGGEESFIHSKKTITIMEAGCCSSRNAWVQQDMHMYVHRKGPKRCQVDTLLSSDELMRKERPTPRFPKAKQTSWSRWYMCLISVASYLIRCDIHYQGGDKAQMLIPTATGSSLFSWRYFILCWIGRLWHQLIKNALQYNASCFRPVSRKVCFGYRCNLRLVIMYRSIIHMILLHCYYFHNACYHILVS
jgi:hypothetical protein